MSEIPTQGPVPHDSERTPLWRIWRQDDYGHCYVVQSGLSQADAARLVAAYTARGHKQLYWATPDRPPLTPSAPPTGP